MALQNAEKSAGGGTLEQAPAQTAQPQKLPNLSSMAELLGEIEKIAETTGEDRSGDWSGTTPGTTAVATGGAITGQSPRDRAIAAIPEVAVMRKELEKHIVTEIKVLRKDIRRITRVRAPGAAFRLNELYTRLRRLNSLLHDLFATSYEVVRRLFVKVFIDKQPIL